MNLYIVTRDNHKPMVYSSLQFAAADIWVDDPEARLDVTVSKYGYWKYISNNAEYYVHLCALQT